MAGDAILQRRKRPNWWLIAVLVLLHVLALYGLAKLLAPDFTSSIEREVVSAFMVTVSVSEPPEAPPEPDEGAQGDPGRKATPREDTAPKTPIKNPNAPQRPRTPSTGSANNSGAAQSGDGSGRAGQGDGPGSGGSGSGTGNGQAIAQKPSVRSGNINDSRDFPIPEGGRSTRFGKSVTVVFTVTTDGLAKNCSVAQSNVDAQATSLVCGLVQQKIRFNPAINQNGQPVEARYGYRVDFRSR